MRGALYFIEALCLTALAVLALTFTAAAQTYTVLHSFSGGADGGSPFVGVTMDRAGNLYGTTLDGGAGYGLNGYGTVFELKHIAAEWVITPLYDFLGGTNDGAGPYGRVILGPDGSLYGTASGGGEGSCTFWYGGCGIVFNLRPPAKTCGSAICPWTETILYRFTGRSDGGIPTGDLIFDGAGNLYGTTVGGGSQDFGTVYKLTPSNGGWTESVLHSFGSGTDGIAPYNGVVFDALGNLYGITVNGGSYGGGTVFELVNTGSGWTGKILYDFQAGSDGRWPYGGVIFDGAGNLYGTTSSNGAYDGGTAFELLPQPSGNWTFKLLYSFIQTGSDELGTPGPQADLVMDATGNLYGTTNYDGEDAVGSVFKLTPADGEWTYTALHNFLGPDGANPFGNLVFDTRGNLYGTTYAGGFLQYGVVFEVTP